MSELTYIDSTIVDEATKTTVSAIKKAVADNTIKTVEQLRNAVYDAFVKQFDEYLTPKFYPAYYGEYEYRNPNVYNSNIFQAQQILAGVFKETEEITKLLVAQQELLITSTDDLLKDLAEVSSQLDVLENEVERGIFFSKGKTIETLFDDFETLTKVDFAEMKLPANIVEGMGVQLPLANDLNRSDKVIDVEVESSSIATPNSALYAEDKLPLVPVPYEGKRFGTLSNARPEGGAWRIETKIPSIDSATPKLKPDTVYSNSKSIRWPEDKSILTNEAPPAGTTKVTTVKYEIIKNGGATPVDTVSQAPTLKPGSTTQIIGWTGSDGIVYNMNDTSVTDVYTYKTVTEEKDVTSTGSGNLTGASNLSDASFFTESETNQDFVPKEVVYIDTVDSKATGVSDPYAKTLTRDDFLYVETKASREQLLMNRLMVLDANQATFWEIEYTPVVQDIVDDIYEESDASSSPADQSNAYARAQQIANTVTNSLGELQKDGLRCTITVKFDAVYRVNYITLDPYLFGDLRDSSFDIVDLKIAPSKDLEYKTIPGFDTEFGNTISIDTNINMSNKHLKRTGSSNKFGFRGRGVWTLPGNTKVYAVKISLEQKTPIPNPYPVKNVQMLRKMSKSISESLSQMSGSVSGFKTNSSSSSISKQHSEYGRQTQWIQFGYLETILDSISSGQNTSMLAGATSGDNRNKDTAASNSFDNTSSTGGIFGMIGGAVGSNVMGITGSIDQAVTVNSVIRGALIMVAGAALDKALSGGDRGSTDSTRSSQFQDTGFQVSKSWYKTLWARVRYAIGIRELSFHARNFESAGEIVSIPYEIHVGEKEITLEVSRYLPTEFLNYNSNESYIKYYIEVDGSRHRIQPIIGEAVQTDSSGNAISSSLNLKNLSTKSTAQIRFVCALSRPPATGMADAGSLSPILHSYKVNIIGS